MLGEETTRRRRVGPAGASVEFGCAVAALLLAIAIVAVILISGSLAVKQDNIFALLESTLLGPVIGFTGAWLDARRGNSLGLILLGFAALLAFDGVFATQLLALPVFLLVSVSLAFGVRRQMTSGAGRNEP